MKTLNLSRPIDCHLHLREGEYLKTTVPASARYFAQAIVMPNLKTPVCDVKAALNYHQKIKAAIPGTKFYPRIALYLTQQTTAAQVQEAKNCHIIAGFKLYPAGATTHSTSGVADFEKIYPALAAMESCDIPLLVHAESMEKEIDIFDREAHFLDSHLATLLKRFPALRVVVEHISSAYGVAWVKSAPANIAATITAHHMLLTRNDLLSGGIKPHFYCLPIVKTQNDKEALIAAATSGHTKFFLGTDSAPHAQQKKESACGSAGIFTAFMALELYAEIFEQVNALDKLEAFASFYGADFYRAPRSTETMTLIKEAWPVPASLPFGHETLVPFRAGEQVRWKVKDLS